MFEKINFLFKNEKPLWDSVDVQHWVQRYLQEETKSDQILCENVVRDCISIRVGTSSLHQEVILLEYDLKKKLKTMTGFELKKLKVFI